MSQPQEDDPAAADRMSMGMLMLIDTFNRVGKDLTSTFTVINKELGALTGTVSTTTKALEKARAVQKDHWDRLHDHLNDLFHQSKATQGATQAVTGLQQAGDGLSSGLKKLGAGALQAGAGVAQGMIMPLKAIPMQIGMLLIKPLMRLIDPFLNVLEDLQIIMEPLVAVLEIFLAPLQEVIGLMAGDLVQAILGNEDTMRRITQAGSALAGMVWFVWETFKPLGEVLLPLIPLLAELAVAVVFLTQPLLWLAMIIRGIAQALGATADDVSDAGGTEPGASGTYTVNNIYVSGNVTTDRQISRGTMELMR